MRASTRQVLLDGPAGKIECAVDEPEARPRGVALVAHPHPLYGGSLDNKVAQTLARAFVELGYSAWRPNFRGVGATAGAHDEGRGEVDDLAAVLGQLNAERPVLAGFSFGAVMQARLARRLEGEGNAPSRLVLVGLAVAGYDPPRVPGDTILIHGDQDTTAPLQGVIDWATPQELPIVLVPGADHFFHRRLHILRGIIARAWR